MNITKMYTVVEIQIEHFQLNTVNDGVIDFIEKFEYEYPHLQIISGTADWQDSGWRFLAKDLSGEF